MVKKKKLENKAGETLTTKEKGEIMYDYKFEVGDVFIPCNNSLIKKVNKDVLVKGVKKTITSYKLKCKVLGFQDEEEIFVSLTPSQADTLLKKINEDKININQHLFSAYEYTAGDETKQVGIGFKTKKTPMKSFDEFKDVLEE